MPSSVHSRDAKAAAESVVERLYLSVRHLATAKGDVRSRLVSVGVTLAPLQEGEFPETLRSDYRWIMNQMTRYEPQYGEGRIEATMNKIQNTTGEKIAQRVFEMYSTVQQIRGNPLV